MTARIATAPAPTCTPARRGFGPLPCPLCQAEAAIDVSLADLSEADQFRCHECEGVFSIDLIRDIIAKWGRVLSWLDTMPELPAE